MTRSLIIFFLAALFLTPGCRKTDHNDKHVFYWNIAAGFNSLDPAYAKTQSNIWLVNQVFNTLVELDDSLHIQASLAKSWEISPDGKTYTFHLRNDVYFQDEAHFAGGKGRKMVASDIKYSFNRILDPKTASPGAWVFHDKVLYDSTRQEAGFYAPSDTVFFIKLEKPYRPFLQLLTLKYCSVVPHEIVEYYGSEFRNHVIGTGPFCLKYYYEGEKIVLHRNPHYFEKPLPYLDAVLVSFNPSKQDEFFSFIKGEQSMMIGLDPSFKDNLLTSDGHLREQFKDKFKFEEIPYLNTEFIGILVDNAIDQTPLTNKKLRQAMNYALDRKKMIRYLKNNTVDAGEYGFVPPYLLPGSKKYYEYNPEKARELLKEIHYTANEPITLSTTSNYLDLAVFIQKQLEDIGIKVNIENVPGSSLSDLKTQSKTNFFRASWVADYADPENFLSVFYSKNWSPAGPNYYHFKNAEFDRLYEAALVEPDDHKRNDDYMQMQDIVMEEAPVMVLFYDKVIRLVDNKVSGLNANPINLVSLKRVKIL